MSHSMTKPTNDLCTQRRLRSAWASALSDQSSLCTLWVAKDPTFFQADSKDSDQTGRICPGWSESSLVTQVICWFCHAAAQIMILVSNWNAPNTPSHTIPSVSHKTRPPIHLLHSIYQWGKAISFLFLRTTFRNWTKLYGETLVQNLEIGQCYMVRHLYNI